MRNYEPTLPKCAPPKLIPDFKGSDRIEFIRLSLLYLPMVAPIMDAKVLTGRQKPLSEIAFLFAEIKSKDGATGIGYSYSIRAGGPGMYAHAKEISSELIGEDFNDISRLWSKLQWMSASMGRSGQSLQAIAALDIALWDLKARRCNLPLSKFLGSNRSSVRCYNTSGGYLSAPLEVLLENATKAMAGGIGGIKIKVGQPDTKADLHRLEAIRAHIGNQYPLMVDANQQWSRCEAMRIVRSLDGFNLTWIEEPLDAFDLEGYAQLCSNIDTPISTGEMLTSKYELAAVINRKAADILQPDAPRIGGISPFIKIQHLAEEANLGLAPHFAMEIHLHLAATFAEEPWVEHFEWSEALFNERLEIANGRMVVPDRPGLGITLSEEARSWTADHTEFSQKV